MSKAEKRIPYWTVEKAHWGLDHTVQHHFRSYEKALEFYDENDYVSEPVKHTAAPEDFYCILFEEDFDIKGKIISR